MNELEIVPFTGFIVLIVLIAGRIFFLKRKGVSVSAGKKKPGVKTLLLYLVFLLILVGWILELVKPVFGFSFQYLPGLLVNPIFESLFSNILGSSIILAALFLMASSLLHFKNSLRFGLDETNQGVLISTGIFSFSRNPFFLSLDLYFTGVAFILPSPFFIGFAILAVVGIHFFILKEEKFLLQHYGKKYHEYKKKVRRYF